MRHILDVLYGGGSFISKNMDKSKKFTGASCEIFIVLFVVGDSRMHSSLGAMTRQANWKAVPQP